MAHRVDGEERHAPPPLPFALRPLPFALCPMPAPTDLARRLKAEAVRLGFDACGIARAERLDEEALRLERWLLEERHATMHWMERHFDKRVDPRELVPGARSVVSVLQSYYAPDEHPPAEHAEDAEDASSGKISRYAQGEDYHRVMKDGLHRLYDWLDEAAGGIQGRVFVDSAPVLDRAWAQRAGLGWPGKHTLLINRTLGSYFFIGEMIVDVPLPPDAPSVQDYCGSCTRCIDACPTGAIYEPYALDAERCISYLTIEHREDDLPEALEAQMEDWIFGCDICQEVCPWNKFAEPTREPRYQPREGMTDTPLQTWAALDEEGFEKRFRDSPLCRAGYDGFMRNVRRALENRKGGKGEWEKG